MPGLYGGGRGALLSAKTLTGLVAVAGVVLRLFCRRPARRYVGDILLGFAILMLGMSTMSGAMEPLGHEPWFTGLLTSMRHPLLGILVGALFTAVLQSASASVGILQALSVTGAMTFEAALPMLLGATVGASVPVMLSAIGASLSGKRTAFVYPLASVFGVAVCAVLFYAVSAAARFSFMERVMDPFSMAMLNTVLRLLLLLLLAPMTKIIERTVCRLLPGEAEERTEPSQLLEERFLRHPSLAVELCRIVLASMAEHTKENLANALALLRDYSDEGFRRVQNTEDLIDRYEDEIGTYIVKLSASELTPGQNAEVYRLLHTITDLERVSDHALNMAENAQEIHEKAISLEDGVNREMAVMEAALTEVMDLALRALTERDVEAAWGVEPLEEHIDHLCEEMKRRQIERLMHGSHSRQNSFVFNDLITNYERVSDHCSNIALAVIELEQDSLEAHSYIKSLMSRGDEAFERSYRDYKKKYSFG